jgi:hypothetical protein
MILRSWLTGGSSVGLECQWDLPKHLPISSYVVEDVLKGRSGARPLPVVVYLDDIAVFGDDQEQVLEDTLEAIHRLTEAGFTILKLDSLWFFWMILCH